MGTTPEKTTAKPTTTPEKTTAKEATTTPKPLRLGDSTAAAETTKSYDAPTTSNATTTAATTTVNATTTAAPTTVNVTTTAAPTTSNTTASATSPATTTPAPGKIILSMKNVQTDAFRPASRNSTEFQSAQECSADEKKDNDIIPIIVGAVLAAMIVITRVVYLIGRKIRAKKAYENVD